MILPGFKAIEYIEAQNLCINTEEYIREGSVIEALGKFTGIAVVSLIDCKISSEAVFNETIYTTVLSFMMEDCGGVRELLYELTCKDCCFRITDVYGKQYLVGTPLRPHPVVQPSFQSEGLPSGLRVFPVKIQYVHTHSILTLR